MKATGRLTELCVSRYKTVTGMVVAATVVLGLLAALPSVWPDTFSVLHGVQVDTDPENMLPADEPVRVFHNDRKKTFALHDMLVVGVVNDTHDAGVFNAATLAKIHELTAYAKTLHGEALGLEDGAGVIPEDLLSLSTVDVTSFAGVAGGGQGVEFAYLMAEPPETQAEAEAIRDRARRMHMLNGSLISEDGKAAAMYVPLTDKHLSYKIYEKLNARIAELGGNEQFHITGLPVAEDTFGVEMFIQMAISAPVAMVVIFILMLVFFRKLVIVIAPMIVAMVSVIVTMAALIIAGEPVHIMSSMIPIFIMPIAVLDSIHIISEFFERYQATRDSRETIRTVMGELFAPMLYTSLTSAAGFASLALTPIPPVQVFGVFVAVGIMIAWLLTVTFIPAYVMFIRPKTLANFGAVHHDSHDGPATALARFLRWVGGATVRRAKPILAVAMVVAGVAAYGMTRIDINDNPVKWFNTDHPIRVADRVLNEHFGGTYMAYLSLSVEEDEWDADAYARQVAKRTGQRHAAIVATFNALFTPATEAPAGKISALDYLDALDARARAGRKAATTDDAYRAWDAATEFLGEAYEQAEEAADPDAPIDRAKYAVDLAEKAKTYADRIGGTFKQVAAMAFVSADANPESPADFIAVLAVEVAGAVGDGPGSEAAKLLVADEPGRRNVFMLPETLRYMEGLQEALGEVRGDSGDALVGKSNSLADIVKTIHRDLVSGEQADYRVPGNRNGVAQCLDRLNDSKRPRDVWHFTIEPRRGANAVDASPPHIEDLTDVTFEPTVVASQVERPLPLASDGLDIELADPDDQLVEPRMATGPAVLHADGVAPPRPIGPDLGYRAASIWVQLRSGDNRDMQKVVAAIDEYVADNPAPNGIMHQWFGLTYINIVWQDKMVSGMLRAFLGSFLIVLVMMTVLFRSVLWGLLSMIPLTITIGLIYGVIGLVGKDYDMPVAVLSSLTLGLAVDFAIHFLARARTMYAAAGSWPATAPNVFGEPARAIMRNIIVIAVGFLPLLLAPLMPYRTVGVLLASILLTSGVATLLLLPALIRLMEKRLFPRKPAMGPTCNCAVCLVSSIAVVVLVAMTLYESMNCGWGTMTWVGAAAIVVLTALCGLMSRRQKCKTPAELAKEKCHD